MVSIATSLDGPRRDDYACKFTAANSSTRSQSITVYLLIQKHQARMTQYGPRSWTPSHCTTYHMNVKSNIAKLFFTISCLIACLNTKPKWQDTKWGDMPAQGSPAVPRARIMGTETRRASQDATLSPVHRGPHLWLPAKNDLVNTNALSPSLYSPLPRSSSPKLVALQMITCFKSVWNEVIAKGYSKLIVVDTALHT